jgi:GTP-binding protein
VLTLRSSEFKVGAHAPRDFPRDGRPQIAFAGRSNVGKSSLINLLLQRRALARTSRAPGRTQQINFFLINGAFWFVDLPGFGYAKVPDKVREQWRRLVESYIKHSEALRAVVFLIDARHGPQANDRVLLDWLLALEVPFIPVLTKADKISRGELARRLREIEREVPVLAACEPIATSAQTKMGREALWERLDAYVKGIGDKG